MTKEQLELAREAFLRVMDETGTLDEALLVAFLIVKAEQAKQTAAALANSQ